ncbi:LysR family transcriptional regulator [Alkalihalobacillus oceani]|uniref:LysR family transcriptional regulator n=1 Tax=Halalkalibacter oceani TaxID=1653776 RepID=UPI002040B04E|nr:LysR family transcriptional regulator [Halalkalibacter oceani]MCM3762098.1 LysR family transcriptional regulator [Halalkalibacter oceani]
MNLNSLYYFKVMAEFQHYTRAAEFLCITQPSLSRAMSVLEKELGVPLFEKDGRNVRLTKYGALLNSHIAEGFREIESGYRMLHQFKKKNSGIIDFSFLFVLGYQFVPNLIKNFQANPEYSQITINFHQCNTLTSLTKIKEGEVDLGLCAYMPDEPDIRFTSVLKQDLVCITSVHHPLAERPALSIEELLPYSIIRYAESAGEIQGDIDRLFEECSQTPETFCTMAEEITMAGLVSSNHNNCIAIVPDLDVLENFSIKKIPLNHPNAYRTIYLATSNIKPLIPCVETFFHFILHYANAYKSLNAFVN